jgi:hypothetical protein
VEAAFQLFFSLMVTECSSERSLSQRKRIKNEFLTLVLLEKLLALSIMLIENHKFHSISSDDIIHKFAFINL